MEFVLWAGLLSGFIATLVMTAMIKMSSAAGMTEMPSFELMTGSMMSGDEKTAKMIGAMIHYVMMGTVLFGIIYALLFQTFDSSSWVTGLVIGIVHGLIVGVMFMPMMPMMHPRMGEPAVVGEPGGEIRLSAPGVMGKKWGSMTPIGVLMGHAVYGVVMALLYDAFV